MPSPTSGRCGRSLRSTRRFCARGTAVGSGSGSSPSPWCSHWWALWAAQSSSPGDPIQAALDHLVEAIGSVAIGVAVLTALLGGIGVRYLGVRTWAVHAACTATLVLSTLIVGIAATMSITTATVSGPAIAYTLDVAIVPFALVAVHSVRCLQTLGQARDLGRPRVRA